MKRASSSIDAFGRIVIPKSARERFGFEPGTELEIDQSGDAVVLRPVAAEPAVQRKGLVLVLTARPKGSVEDRVALDRAARAEHLGLPGRR